MSRVHDLEMSMGEILQTLQRIEDKKACENWDSEIEDDDEGFSKRKPFEPVQTTWDKRDDNGCCSVEPPKPLQSHVAARFDLIPAECLKLLAECLGFGAQKYYPQSWKQIPIEDHINHLLNHVNLWRMGDTSEPHLVNAFTRACFALWCEVNRGGQMEEYIHPEKCPCFAQIEHKAKKVVAKGKIPDLQKLYACFGIDKLSELMPPDYAAFAHLLSKL